MNILNIVDGIIEDKTNNSITCTNKNNKLHINIKKDIEFCICFENNKLIDGININIDENSSVRIFLILNARNKLNIKINIQKNSNLLLNKFISTEKLEENININLNGINSQIEYYHSCLGNIKEDLNIYHNSKKTNSLVKNYGITNNETQEFNITEIVPKGMTECKLSQKSKIINLGINSSTIRPILLIDEKEVNAIHSSVISPINKSDVFYLMSRGITEENSIRLLTNGFLINNLNLKEKEKHLLFEKYIFRR
ncbi:MAG: SufD family Fe-S cluster assembly protein [Firmicutes bacterium]|nr:SufD family Fe-S cluster assembly protein [Bacillota bacterium]